MSACVSALRAQHHLLLWLSFLLSACVVNPVPTPGSAGSATSAPGGGVDRTKATDAAAQNAADAGAFATSADAADGAAPPAAPVAGSLVEATATQAGVSGAFGGHYAAFAAGAPSTGRLVVLLPDTAEIPSHYTAVAQIAAQRGNRVLVLAYPNAPAAASLCGQDAGCFEYVRHETLDGQDRSPKVTVDFANSVEQRLASALHWLDQNRKGEGWGGYVNGSTPDWAKIVLAGHGEGADLAGFIGKKKSLARVVLLAGPGDATAVGPATWLASKAVTAASSYFALAHTADPGFKAISANWVALGVGPSCTAIVDQKTFSGARCLTLSTQVQSPHAAVATDAAQAMDAGGTLLLQPTYWYLFAP